MYVARELLFIICNDYCGRCPGADALAGRICEQETYRHVPAAATNTLMPTVLWSARDVRTAERGPVTVE